MQDSRKTVRSIPYVSVVFFPSLKQNFIEYCSSKVSSRPDCIFEILQLWQSGFSRVYSNCCCSCSFEPEIIKISQSSHKMYSNNIVDFQESTIVLNACTKKCRNLLEALRILQGDSPDVCPFDANSLYSLVSSSLLVPLIYSFLIFYFITTYLMVSASIIPKYLQVSFSPNVLLFCWFGRSIPAIISCFPLIFHMAHFLPNYIPISCLYILIFCIRVPNTFLFLIISLMSVSPSG